MKAASHRLVNAMLFHITRYDPCDDGKPNGCYGGNH